MPYSPILATLGYVLSADGTRVLMVHRNRRPEDLHFGKYNGLGGKLHADEDVVACMRREIKEEADIECQQLALRGTISWPGFGKQGEDWFGFIFLITAWTGTPRQSNAEGELLWVDLAQVERLPLWDGDRHFLPLVFADDDRQFHGVMPYQGGQPVSWTCSWLSLPGASSVGDSGPSAGKEIQTRQLVRSARQALAQKDPRRAIDLLDIHRPAEWTVLDAHAASVLRLLGQAYSQRGDWRAARECLEQLRTAQREQAFLPAPHYAAALTELYQCYLELSLGDLAQALRAEIEQCLL